MIPPRAVELMAGADAILHAGDLIEVEVLEALERLGPPLHAVRGNVDSAQVQARLPLTRIVEADGARIAMIHDAGQKDGRLRRMRNRFPDADAVVFGHSHLPLHEHDGAFQLFNPGSPTERRRAPEHTIGVATVTGGRLAFELIVL